MSDQNSNGQPRPTPIPRQARLIKRVLDPLYRFFDWLYGSEFNPLYRSGTLAVGFLMLLFATGLYLCFFYSISQPYESLTAIQNQIWTGRWVRTVHRYATVAAIFAILFHVLQLMAQGKCWGPRTLAWVSGILLTGIFMLSAWSGYVMVWDAHGQRVAIAGAELLATIPVLRDVVTAAFNGTADVPAGFFFMNLFLHVALPLVLIMMLWVHTAKLSRAVWFPRRAILVWSIGGLILAAIAIPAPLLEKASLLKVVGRIPTDLSVGFWMGWNPILTILFFFGGAALLAAIPWWWRTRRDERRPISVVDTAACSGCTQCARDCPYEAIKMVPRPDGKRLLAEILPANCVSCGICAASCADFAVGPPGRTARDQQQRVAQFCAEAAARAKPLKAVLIACANNPGLNELLGRCAAQRAGIAVYPVECCGCVHSEVIEQILKVSSGCALVGCPARNCFNRDGGELLEQRIFEKRVPFLERSIDRSRLLIAAYSEAEEGRVDAALTSFIGRLEQSAASGHGDSANWRRFRAFCASTALLLFCAFAAQVPAGEVPRHALLRIAGVFNSTRAEDCRPPTDADIAGMPKHMRPLEICERQPITYRIVATVDGEALLQKQIQRSDGRADQQLLVSEDLSIAPGKRHVEISIEGGDQISARCSVEVELQAGEIFLAHFRRVEQDLECRGAPAKQ